MSLEVELFLWADRLCPRETLYATYGELKRSLPHVAGSGGMAGGEPGIFPASGERMYPDTNCGCAHLEIAYPLFAQASRLTAAYCAGFQRIYQATQVVAKTRDMRVQLFASNCCYDPLGVTFGIHENYTYRGELETFVENIAPLQVGLSQPCGAGGFDNQRVSLRYVDAARKLHVARIAGSSTRSGWIALVDRFSSYQHGRFQRRQLLTADQVHPRYAHQLWLRLAITRAFVWLCEQGIVLDDALRLAKPLSALHAAQDGCWDPRIEMQSGNEITLWEFQRRLRRFLKRRLEDLPSEIRDETARACQLWERLSDALENDPAEADRLMSWCGQLSMLKQYTEWAGYDWQELQLADRILLELHKAENVTDWQSDTSTRHDFSRHPYFERVCKLLGADCERVNGTLQLLPRLQYLSVKWHEVGDNLFSDQTRSDIPEINLAASDIQAAKHRYVGNVPRELQRCELLQQHLGRPDASAGWDNFNINGSRYRWPDPWSSAIHTADPTTTTTTNEGAER